MQSRGLSQAQMARAVGVADAQVSRWRRGQVVPTVHYLQRIADTLDVPRAGLDRLAGYPVDATDAPDGAGDDPTRQAELQAYQSRFTQVLQQQVPPALWAAYAEACEALARSLAASYAGALETARGTPAGAPPADELAAPAGDSAASEEPPPPDVPAPRRKGPIGFRAG
jgi:transcriptional regulator with XRE-family HTH domain